MQLKHFLTNGNSILPNSCMQVIDDVHCSFRYEQSCHTETVNILECIFFFLASFYKPTDK